MAVFAVKIMPQADEELEDIAYFIALDSPQSSQRFITELITKFTDILDIFLKVVWFIRRIFGSFLTKATLPFTGSMP